MNNFYSKNDLTSKTWIKHWAGYWKLLNNSLLGFQYTKMLKDSLGQGLKVAFFVSHEGYSVCYLDQGCYEKFGKSMVANHMRSEEQANDWSSQLMTKTDDILKFIGKFKKKEITMDDYFKFLDFFYAYGTPHRVIKIAVDFLAPDKLELYLPVLSKARVYAEPVYAETEKFLERLAQQIAQKNGYNKKYLSYMLKEEMDSYWKEGKLPDKTILSQRYHSCTLQCQDGNNKLFVENGSDSLEKILNSQIKSKNLIKGTAAYKGKVKGRVRIIFDPEMVDDFQEGDILVTGMTRPEYTSLIKKSAAFITDAGGILSHAAISAREFKKTCIVGTVIATKALKDGDLVEVNADEGVIKIL